MALNFLLPGVFGSIISYCVFPNKLSIFYNALNSVLSCSSSTFITLKISQFKAGIQALHLLFELSSFISKSQADQTSSFTSAPSATSLFKALLLGAISVFDYKGGTSNPPLKVDYRLPLAKTNSVKTIFVKKSSLNQSLFLSALTLLTSFQCNLQSLKKATQFPLQLAHRYFDLSSDQCSLVLCVFKAHYLYQVFALHICIIQLKLQQLKHQQICAF